MRPLCLVHKKYSVEATQLDVKPCNAEQVASAIKIVLKSSQPNLVIKLDMQRMEAQGYAGITSDSVQLSIIKHPKIKLKSEV